MMKHLPAILILLSTLLTLPACAEDLYDRIPKVGTAYSDRYRYKMTVEVETPEGVKSGSAVREIYARDSTNQLIGGVRGVCANNAKGEAVVVDLGKRGVLFVLLTQGGGSTDHMWQVVHATFPRDGILGGSCLEEGIKYYASLKAEGDVPLKAMPMMVTFADMDDPTSVQYVYGAESYQEPLPHGGSKRAWRLKEDNFEKLFGRGVKLHRVKLEMADEPVTEEVGEWLSWLNKLQGNYLHNGLTARGAPLGLHAGSFKKGE